MAGVLLGVPLVAAGITLTALDFATWRRRPRGFLAAVCLLVALFAMERGSARSGLGRDCHDVSSPLLRAWPRRGVCLGQLLGAEWLDIPWMVRTHGTLNAIGYALLGLVGWRMNDGERMGEVGEMK